MAIREQLRGFKVLLVRLGAGVLLAQVRVKSAVGIDGAGNGVGPVLLQWVQSHGSLLLLMCVAGG